MLSIISMSGVLMTALTPPMPPAESCYQWRIPPSSNPKVEPHAPRHARRCYACLPAHGNSAAVHCDESQPSSRCGSSDPAIDAPTYIDRTSAIAVDDDLCAAAGAAMCSGEIPARRRGRCRRRSRAICTTRRTEAGNVPVAACVIPSIHPDGTIRSAVVAQQAIDL